MTTASNVNRRAKQFAGERGAITQAQWEIIKRRADYRCLCCQRKEPDILLTIDHVIPLSRGGTNTRRNIQPLCEKCNRNKGDAIKDYRKWRVQKH